MKLFTKRPESGKKPVKVPYELHSALQSIQRQFKKQRGVEPSLGELVERAFQEDPLLRKVLEQELEEESKRLEESFMSL